MKREILSRIYDKLSDNEKKAWAMAAGYAAYQGLYKYLRTKSDSVAFNVSAGLLNAIGEEKIRLLVKEIKIEDENNDTNLDECKRRMIKIILKNKDKNTLEELKKDILIACNNQLKLLELESLIEQ